MWIGFFNNRKKKEDPVYFCVLYFIGTPDSLGGNAVSLRSYVGTMEQISAYARVFQEEGGYMYVRYQLDPQWR